MQTVPILLGIESADILLDLFRTVILAKSEALSDAEDMGVNGKRGNPESLTHNHIGRFSSDAGKADEIGKISGNNPVLFRGQSLGQGDDIPRLGVGETDGADQLVNRRKFGLSQSFSIGISPE